MRAFHATAAQNVAPILQFGILRKFEGVYLSDSLEGAANWKALVMKDGDRLAIIEVEIDGRKLRNGNDHHPMMQAVFGAGKSLLSLKSIPPSKIVAHHIVRITKQSVTRPVAA